MGRPLKKQLFGTPSSTTDTLKVQFHNGADSVPGYIIKQTGSKRFVCKDANGNTAVCYMVDKDASELLPNEMTFTVLWDDSTISHPIKISQNLVTVESANYAKHWTFTNNQTDGYVQMEEAGSDASLTGREDIEGDETIPVGLFDKPAPGSGSYDASITPNTTVVGTPYAPGSNVSSITSATLGLWRKKFKGNFGGSAGDGCDVTFCRTTKGFFGKPDTYVSFGFQNDPSEENYTFEWVGYFKAPSSGNFNFYINSDDDVFFWIGTNALGTANTEANAHMGVSGGSEAKNTNSVTLVADQYYPVRIQFGEYTGAEECQLFYAKVGDATAVAGNNGLSGTQVWYHNSITKGY